jgi:probable FeS assembly SUF system protein SufT
MSDQPISVRPARGFLLPRDCTVTIVPAGHSVTLSKGDRVKVLQALGGTVTITTGDGEMARLAATDAIDLGLIDAPTEPATSSDEPFHIDRVWDAAATVYDPEIPVNIVELGLVYRVDTAQLPSGGWRVDIDMSVTAPFCGMGDILRQDLHAAVATLGGVEEVQVNLVFDPPWDVSRLSDVARLELGMM